MDSFKKKKSEQQKCALEGIWYPPENKQKQKE
jgi:hypothetical protein